MFKCELNFRMASKSANVFVYIIWICLYMWIITSYMDNHFLYGYMTSFGCTGMFQVSLYLRIYLVFASVYICLYPLPRVSSLGLFTFA